MYPFSLHGIRQNVHTIGHLAAQTKPTSSCNDMVGHQQEALLKQLETLETTELVLRVGIMHYTF